MAFTIKQKRIFAKLITFMKLAVFNKFQLFFIVLTSHNNPLFGMDELSRDHLELRQRVIRKYGYQVGHFQVVTVEGFGVIHAVWALKGHGKNACFVDQKWMSDQWQKIHKAFIVSISRIDTQDEKQMIRAALYDSGQYIAGQEDQGIVSHRASAPFLKVALGEGFKAYTKIVKSFHEVSYTEVIKGREIEVRKILNKKLYYENWFKLLCNGRVEYFGYEIVIDNKKVRLIDDAVPF